MLYEPGLCFGGEFMSFSEGNSNPVWGIRREVVSAPVLMHKLQRSPFSCDHMAELEKVHMRCFVGHFLTVILSGDSPNLAQPFGLSNKNKFVS